MNQKYLRDIFDYHPSGRLIHKKRRPGCTVGKMVEGSVRKDGRRRIDILRDGKRKSYLHYRLIYLWHHGYLPEQIDHINRDPSDDRIENLRETDHVRNAHNANLSKRNSSGHTGVSPESGKWRVRVYYKGKNHNGGLIADFDEACATADRLRNQLTSDSEPV